ncbi:hypothetical protein GCM10020367_49140 [Streptomyces sannanensis]|uniref:Uncharacterized protein n=1 Tax=Streptomyces sannanensis TaxID=285536 RepID=A0ABP6SGY6_9ACTN
MFAQLNGLLMQLEGQIEGRISSSPSACVIDIQSVKTSTSLPTRSQESDAGIRGAFVGPPPLSRPR